MRYHLVENACVEYLRGARHEPNLDIPEREEARRRIRAMLGRAFYLGRVTRDVTSKLPKDSKYGVMACVVSRQGTQVEYDLQGEHPIQQAQLYISIHSRAGAAARNGALLAGYIRAAMSDYTGTWTYRDADGSELGMEIHGCQLGDFDAVARPGGDSATDWPYTYRQTAVVTFRQNVLSSARTDL